jgi:hypothetical protein
MAKAHPQNNRQKFKSFITDVAVSMKKHGITDAVVIFGLDDELRNTYIPLAGAENPLYCKISDAFDDWLRQGYADPTVKDNN